MSAPQSTQANSDEEMLSHYQSAGTALLLVGILNALVATSFLIRGTELSFINPFTMLVFGLGFVATGFWMRSFQRVD